MNAARKSRRAPTGAASAAKHSSGFEGSMLHVLESEHFTDIDRHFGRFLERLAAAPNPELALAAALVSRSQGQGNTCLDLRSTAGSMFPNGPTTTVRVALPTLESWLPALRRSPVVGKPSEFKPLILDDRGRLYLHRYWEYEFNLAKAILHRAGQPAISINESRLQTGLNRLFPGAPTVTEPDLQRKAVEVAVRQRFCVISGGPGTGKTRTVIALLVLLLEQSSDRALRIALAAPTGKAAARLQESLRRWRTTLACNDSIRMQLPDESFTLHRLLGGLPDSVQFKHGAENPLPFDVVVVDEASMVDLALMAKLFAATPPSSRLLLLGDKDQLASVEAGAVLGDICAGAERPAPLSKCIVELRRNYRFGAENGILALSLAIKNGDAEGALQLLRSGSNKRETGAPDGVSAVALPPPARLKDLIRNRVTEGFSALLKARQPESALQLLSRFRILCALRKGPFGVETVNRIVEEVLSETGLISTTGPWYPGRPVLVTRNDYQLKLYNGDVGMILPEPTSGELFAWFAGADGLPRSLPLRRLPEHETVFAMTVHKSQGSEFDDVLFVLPDRENPVLTRELVYTAVTRASRRVELCFDDEVFRSALARRVERASGLREALWEAPKP